MLDLFKLNAYLSIDLCLVDQLLALHCFFKHLVAELFALKPACAILLIILDLTGTSSGWHFLKTIDDGQILGLHVLIEVIECSEFFW